MRQFGVYVGPHSLAHAMLFFSFIYIYSITSLFPSKTIVNYLLHFLFVASVYCLWNSYVRSAYVGFIVFWASYLFLYKKRYFIIFLSLFIIFFIWKLPDLKTIFMKTEEFSLNAASSGRMTLWTHNMFLFLDSPFYYKLLGHGIGSELKTVYGAMDQVWSSHNDYLTLLMTVGIFGLILYLSIIIVLLKDIIYSDVNKNIKAIFLSSVLSLLTTSMVTNSFIVRFEISQLFWIFMGCFYCHQSIHVDTDNKG
jgi:O-antigen ligase